MTPPPDQPDATPPPAARFLGPADHLAGLLQAHAHRQPTGLPLPVDPLPPLTSIDDLATFTHELYVAFVRAGFDDGRAFDLAESALMSLVGAERIFDAAEAGAQPGAQPGPGS